MSRFALILLLLLYFINATCGQSIPTIRVSALRSDTVLSRAALWKTTPKAPLSADTLGKAGFRRLAGSAAFNRDSTYWARFDVINDTPLAHRLVLFTPGANDRVHVYFSADSSFQTIRHRTIGLYTSFWESDFRFTNLMLPVHFAAGQTRSFLVKIDNRYLPAPSPALRLLTEQEVRNDFWNYYSSHMEGTFLSVFIAGAVLAIFLFIAFLYITTRDTLYLYYGLYLGGVFFYFSTKTDTLFFLGYLTYGYPEYLSILNEPIQLVYTALYIRFCMGLLRIREYDPALYRFLAVFWKGLLVYSLAAIVIAALVWRREFDQNLLAFDRVLLLLFNVVMLGRILQKNRSPLLVYFLVGNIFFITGVVVSTITSLGLVAQSYYANLSPINYFQIGVFGEIMCFSFALGYNVRLLQMERIKNQKAYIQQLRLNQEFTEDANRQLQEKLDERTREVLAMSKALREQQEAHLRSEFEFQLGEMEMQALRAQMNPHFIFNSLNTIRYFVLNNENEKASDYLGKFARLLRLVLQNSRENTISLSEELAALRLYVEIEARRFGDSFQYQILVPEEIDTDAITVPPLLLQPFVENAVWHGLLHSNKPDRQLTVQISEEEDEYLFMITDNGIGRQKSGEMRSRPASLKKSFGMQITNKRVELFNKNFGAQIKISVRDLILANGEAGGTVVEIRYTLPA
jgi:sensor histidine kinase YesM